MYITPSRASSDHLLLILNLPFKVILRRFEADVFLCLEWECCHFKRLMKIHSNPPILYNGFKFCPPELYFSILEGSRSLRSLNIQSLIYRACVIDWLSPISCSMMIQMIMNERLSGRGWIAVACTDRLVISLDVGCGSEWLAWPALLNGGKFGTAFPLLALVYTRQDRRGIPYHVVYFQRNYALELHSY